jgi:metal-responsive CopG/Arc/MetJ family transcriptional regulator
MKATISLPARLFNAADALARRLGITRSRLYANALAEYVAKHQAAKATERLNTIYQLHASRLDAGLRRVQGSTVARHEW